MVLKVFRQRIVGWAMANHLRTELILEAQDMTLFRRQPRDVIHHSDQGCQYTSLAFGSRCREAGVRPSMGSVGDCFDHVMCDWFFAALECRLLANHRFQSQAAARQIVFNCIEGWHNSRRRQSSITFRRSNSREGTKPSSRSSRTKKVLKDPSRGMIMLQFEAWVGGWRVETALRAAADHPQSSPANRNGATPLPSEGRRLNSHRV
uniref:Integrase catalytic domain-containing protein n=1 Tax=Eiseniibacteriota bacterium TaxID=2212470 RepID=A0A832MLZ4_UNCEI